MLVFYLSAGRVKIQPSSGVLATATDAPSAAEAVGKPRRSSTVTNATNGPYSTDLPTSFTLPSPSSIHDASASPSPASATSDIPASASFSRRDSASSSLTAEEEDENENHSGNNSKKSLMSRMARMGQAILPPPPTASASASTAAAEDRIDDAAGPDSATTPLWMMNGNSHPNGVTSIHATAPIHAGAGAPIHSSVMMLTPQGYVPAPTQLPVSSVSVGTAPSSQALAPYVGGAGLMNQALLYGASTPTPGMSTNGAPQHHLLPQSLHQPQPTIPAASSSLDSQLAPILVSENRQQNTEVRMSIDKVLTKIDEMKNAMASLEQKVGCPVEQRRIYAYQISNDQQILLLWTAIL